MRLRKGDTVLFDDDQPGTVTGIGYPLVQIRGLDGAVAFRSADALTLVPRSEPGRPMRFAGMSTRETAVHSYGSSRVRSGPMGEAVRIPDPKK